MKSLAFWAFIFLSSLPGLAQTRSTEQELQALKDKVLTLRNFSRSSEIHFDEAGIPKKIEDPAPWALYSQFLVRTIDLKPNRLLLRGPRIVSHFDSKMKKMVQFRSNLTLEVTIDLKPGDTTPDLVKLLNGVFIRPEGLVGRVPSYWKEFLQSGKPSEEETNPSKDVVVQRLSGDIMQARLVKKVVPKYPEEAKQYSFEGYVMFRAEISETGDVEKLMILSPAGAGFDENAAEAVFQWKYTPQTLNGMPVRVITTLTVNYSFSR